MSKYALSGRFVAKSGKRAELVEILLQASRELEKDPGCLHYVISITQQPNDIWVTEAWVDQAAHDAALQPAAIRSLIQTAMPLIVSMDSQRATQILGGKL